MKPAKWPKDFVEIKTVGELSEALSSLPPETEIHTACPVFGMTVFQELSASFPGGKRPNTMILEASNPIG